MHILIVDDEPLARQRLIKLLSDAEGCEVIGEAANGEAAIEAVNSLDPDLVFMDVRMPGVDGLSAAKTISAMEDPPAILFCTAYDEYALEAFDVQAVGYLVKPVQRDKLVDALNKAQKTNKLQRNVVEKGAALEVDKGESEGQRKHISAKSRKGVELVPLEDIFCFVADQKYVTVVHAQGETLIDDTLKELEKELGEAFIRVHRNSLVAVKNIIGLERFASGQYEVKLADTNYRPMVSRRHVARIKALLQRL